MSDYADLASAIDLAENADPRCSIALVLDASSSMAEVLPGETVSSLEALNSGLDLLVTELNKDPLARRRVEISFVVYGSEVSPATPFTTVDNLVVPTLSPSGLTSTGKAIEVALDALEARKRDYKSNGVDYYRPQLLLVSDGLSTDSLDNAVARIAEAEAAKKLTVFAVGVEGADLDQLSRLSPTRGALKLKGLNFGELFAWLSASQSAISASQPGDRVALPSPAGWAEF